MADMVKVDFEQLQEIVDEGFASLTELENSLDKLSSAINIIREQKSSNTIGEFDYMLTELEEDLKKISTETLKNTITSIQGAGVAFQETDNGIATDLTAEQTEQTVTQDNTTAYVPTSSSQPLSSGSTSSTTTQTGYVGANGQTYY